jgi:transposase
VLQDAGIKLSSVATDIIGASGRAMLAALVAAERNPQVLAELAPWPAAQEAPPAAPGTAGSLRRHHGLLVGLSLEHLKHLEAAITKLDAQVDRVIAPFAEARDRLDTITEVGKRAAEPIIAEIGTDMGVFPTAAHLAS